jgi:hypothetical protein
VRKKKKRAMMQNRMLTCTPGSSRRNTMRETKGRCEAETREEKKGEKDEELMRR